MTNLGGAQDEDDQRRLLSRWGMEDRSSGVVDVHRRIANETTIVFNVAQDVVMTTKDKLRLVLNDYLGKLVRTTDWLSPLALCLGIVLQLATTDFKDKTFGVDGVAWRTIFVLVGVAALVRTVWVLVALKRRVTVETVVDQICEAQPNA